MKRGDKKKLSLFLLWYRAAARAIALDFHPVLIRLHLRTEGDTGVVLHVVHSLQQANMAGVVKNDEQKKTEWIQNDEQQNSELTK